MTIPKTPGTPGEATPIEDDVVGITTTGVLIDSHAQTWAYDMCNGHSDKKGQYHYHIPAMCFLDNMGVAFADSADWWINDEMTEVRNYEEMAAQFPATADPSPVIGFARDGFPIYALYDKTGALQLSQPFGGDLDECNGKTDADGNYSYFISATPPFTPTCLKGQVGRFAYSSSSVACPADGIENSILTMAQVDLCLETVATGRQAGDMFEALSVCDVSSLQVGEDSGSKVAGYIATAAGAAALGALLL